MTCPLTCPLAGACIAPSCRPGAPAWRARSSAPADVEAFLTAVRGHMRTTGAPFGKACEQVFKAAMSAGDGCMLS